MHRHPAACGGRGAVETAITAGRHLGAGVLVVAGACGAVFMTLNWLPGDPARAQLSITASAAQVAAEQRRLGLDQSVLSRLLDWFGHAAAGDLGHSWTTGRPVTTTVAPALANSTWLVAATVLVVVPALLATALVCGLRPGGLVDRTVLSLGAAASAVPSFVVGVLASWLFTARLGWLPALSSPDPTRSMLTQLRLLVLPVGVLGLGMVSYLVQVVRAQVVAVAASPFVEAARLRGVSPAVVVRRHLLPSVVPVIGQLWALALIALTTETVVVEVVFGYPGIGLLLEDSVANQDLPVVQGLTLVIAVVVVLATGFSAVLSTVFGPRARTGGR